MTKRLGPGDRLALLVPGSPAYVDLVLTEGVQTHAVEGVPLRVYNPAKTVADYFKFRHKIGLDVAPDGPGRATAHGAAVAQRGDCWHTAARRRYGQRGVG